MIRHKEARSRVYGHASHLVIWSSYLVIFLAGLHCSAARAAALDLTKAVVICPDNLSRREAKALDLLVDEVYERSLVRWERSNVWPTDSTAVIAVGAAARLPAFGGRYSQRLNAATQANAAEGYQISIERDGRSSAAVFVIGNDPRGVLFGI